jgi:hypothetical protein
MLGNSGKPVNLETLSLTKFLRYVFQEQGIHDFRESWTCEKNMTINWYTQVIRVIGSIIFPEKITTYTIMKIA